MNAGARGLAFVLLLVVPSAWANQDKKTAAQVAVAQNLLAMRERVLARVVKDFPETALNKGQGAASFIFPADFAFLKNSDDLSARGEKFLGVLKEYAVTYRTLYIRVVVEKAPGTPPAVEKRRGRQAVQLGSRFAQLLPLPPQNLYLHSRRGLRDRFHIVVQTFKPAMEPSEENFQGVRMNLRQNVFDMGKAASLRIDLSLLDPARVQRWSLKLIHMKTGRLIKRFSGAAELWTSLAWDGQDERGNPAPAGTYQAFLSASTLAGGRLSDSVGFVVKAPAPVLSALRSKSAAAKLVEPLPPPTEAVQPSRQWAQEIHFTLNRSGIAGTNNLEIRQLAGSLQAFPEEVAMIEGFAAEDEKNAAELAEARARTVRDALVSQFAVPPERLRISGAEPRRALEGEVLQKAVVFFLEPELP